MFLLILAIAITTVVFTLLLHFEENTLYKKNCLNKYVLLSIIFNSIIFVTIFFYPTKIYLFVFGVLILAKGFMYLGIFKNINSFLNDHLTALSFILTVITASSNLELESAVFVLIIYYFIFFISSPVLNSSNLKSSEYFIVLLELNRVIAGIFIFIIGLVISADRIPFLAKIANNLF